MMSEAVVLDQLDPSLNEDKKESLLKLSSSAGDIIIQESDTKNEKSIQKTRTPRRTIHFSDGVIEEYSTDEEEKVEEVPKETTSTDSIKDPKDFKWIPWLIYYASFSGCSAFQIAESIGEKLGWFFGITSPKYYYEIQEFKRNKKEEEEKKVKIETHNWNRPCDQSVITLDPKKLPSKDLTDLIQKTEEEQLSV